MVRYARESQRDPAIRLLAETITQHIGSKDTLSEILSLYYFTLQHCRYVNDPRTVELVKRPEWIARQIAAGVKPGLDCDDLACFGAALNMSLGREVRFITAAFRNSFHNNERQFSHVYLQVKEGRTGKWITLDPVAAEDTKTMLGRVVALKIWGIA